MQINKNAKVATVVENTAINGKASFVVFLSPAEISKTDDLKNRPVDKEHVAGLLASIKLSGLDSPIGTWGGDEEGTQMEVGKGKTLPANFLIYGNHRLTAIKQLQQEDPKAYAKLFPQGIPVRRYVCSLEEALCVQLRENVMRRDIPDEQVLPVIQKLIDAGWKQRNIAKEIGKSEGWVSVILDITKSLGKEGEEALAKGELNLKSGKQAANDVKNGKDKATAIADAKKNTRKQGGRHSGVSRVKAITLHEAYQALSEKTTQGRRVQILENVLAYLANETDELVSEMQPEAPAKGKK